MIGNTIIKTSVGGDTNRYIENEIKDLGKSLTNEQHSTVGKENTEGQEEEKKKRLIETLTGESSKVEIKNTSLEYRVHEATNQVLVKVIDNNTSKVIKEIPSEKMLDMAAKRMELAGLFVDKKY